MVDQRCNRPAIFRYQPWPLSRARRRGGTHIHTSKRAPQAFNHPVVDPTAFSVRTDLDLCLGQHVDPSTTGELAALIGVEYLWRTIFCQRLFQRFHAEVGIHAVGQPPGKHLAAEPIHDCHKIEKAAPHRDVGDIRTAHPRFTAQLSDRHTAFRLLQIPMICASLYRPVFTKSPQTSCRENLAFEHR